MMDSATLRYSVSQDKKLSSLVTGGSSSVTIDASDFKAGMYVVKVKKLSGEVLVSKFIKR